MPTAGNPCPVCSHTLKVAAPVCNECLYNTDNKCKLTILSKKPVYDIANPEILGAIAYHNFTEHELEMLMNVPIEKIEDPRLLKKIEYAHSTHGKATRLSDF